MSSTLPAALDALVAGFTTVVPSGVVVVKGEPFRVNATDIVCVAYSDSPTTPSASVAQTPGSLKLDRARETYDIANQVTVGRPVTGSPAAALDVATVRVFALHDLIADHLVADSKLGGAVMQAQMTGWDFTHTYTDGGAVASIAFTIRVQAFRS